MKSGCGVLLLLQYSLNGPPSLTLSSSSTPNVVTTTSTTTTSTSTSSSCRSRSIRGGGGVVGKRRRLSTKLIVNNNNIRMTMMSAATSTITTTTGTRAQLEAQPKKNRRLILLRHAESSWDNPSLRDHQRPISKGGEADAAKLSLNLQLLGWIPQLILSSDAVRSRETLRIMQKHAPAFSDAQVLFIPSFYSVAAMDGQTAHHLQHIICTYSRDDILTVMCMGHNRGWEEAASMFAGASVELKTCNAALLQSTGNSWPEAFTSAGLGGWKLLGVVKPNGI